MDFSTTLHVYIFVLTHELPGKEWLQLGDPHVQILIELEILYQLVDFVLANTYVQNALKDIDAIQLTSTRQDV